MLQMVPCEDSTCKYNRDGGLCMCSMPKHEVTVIPVLNKTFTVCVSYEDARCEDDTR